MAEQWSFVPHVVNELLKLDGSRKYASLPKEQLSQLAIKCKKIYQAEFARMDSDDKGTKGQSSSPATKHHRKTKSDDDHYDSDDTIEMTEEEIDLACRQLPGLCG